MPFLWVFAAGLEYLTIIDLDTTVLPLRILIVSHVDWGEKVRLVSSLNFYSQGMVVSVKYTIPS